MEIDRLEALTKLAFFLVYLKQANPDMMFGSYTMDEAWASFTALMAPKLTPKEFETRLLAVQIPLN